MAFLRVWIVVALYIFQNKTIIWFDHMANGVVYLDKRILVKKWGTHRVVLDIVVFSWFHILLTTF